MVIYLEPWDFLQENNTMNTLTAVLILHLK